MTGACTIVSPNYLPFARTLAKSYLSQHPDHQFYVLIVADAVDRIPFATEPFTVVLLSELPFENLKGIAMKYDILELNTNVKPTFMKYLVSKFDLQRLLYLDPDICVYSTLDPVFELLDSASVVLTPHLTSPIPEDGRIPSEQEMLYNGTYNLGFIAIRRDAQSESLLNWWETRCLQQGFSEGRTGLFVDQKWMNLAPCLFPGVQVTRHLGCNMAYWNLSERWLSNNGSRELVNDTDVLCFYHFSGISVDDPTVLSRNTDRFTLADRPDLRNLFDEYRATVKANRVPKLDSLAYGFDHFTDGTHVNRLTRRIYSKHSEFERANPFDSDGRFYKFCKRNGLLLGKRKAEKTTWANFNPSDRRVRAVHKLLRMALSILGPERYELLMRYLSHISVLRNQSVFIKD